MTILTEKAMLVRHAVKGKGFGRGKADKEISADVARRHDADIEKAGKYRKALIAPRFTEKLDDIGARAYEYHVKNTLPWDDEGWRLLPSQNYFDYMSAQRTFREQFKSATTDFARTYDEAIEEARTRLGTMFKLSDFPDPDKLFERDRETGEYKRFVVNVIIQPIPDQSDFRVDLNEMETVKIKADLERRMQGVLTAAIGDLWGRLRDPIENLRDRLDKYETAERKLWLPVWIDNIKAVIEMIPKLDFTGDPELARICREAEMKLSKWNSDQIRTSKATREFVRTAADDILEAMAGYCGEPSMQEAA
jgi:hypothetical protein